MTVMIEKVKGKNVSNMNLNAGFSFVTVKD
jgi:hypothetical protein